ILSGLERTRLGGASAGGRIYAGPISAKAIYTAKARVVRGAIRRGDVSRADRRGVRRGTDLESQRKCHDERRRIGHREALGQPLDLDLEPPGSGVRHLSAE